MTNKKLIETMVLLTAQCGHDTEQGCVLLEHILFAVKYGEKTPFRENEFVQNLDKFLHTTNKYWGIFFSPYDYIKLTNAGKQLAEELYTYCELPLPRGEGLLFAKVLKTLQL